MTFGIYWSDRLKVEFSVFQKFVQLMANRYLVGDARYGKPNIQKNYLSKLEKEIKAYKTSGNAEHLINAANYCLLENIAPENEKHHYNPLVGSVTRISRNR